MNTDEHENIGFSPLEIVYGRNVIKGSNPFLSAKQKRSSQRVSH